jgi:peptide chain release factor-like protein
MEAKYKFTTIRWSRIYQRGWIAYVDERLPKGMWNPNHLVGEVVEINREKFRVTGVEKFAIGISPETPYLLNFGLLVEEYKEPSMAIDDSDIKVDIFSNEAGNTVRVTHTPTGLVASCGRHKSRLHNKKDAMEILKARILEKNPRSV